MRFALLSLAGVLAVASFTGCGGVSDCGEDAAKCAAMLNAQVEKCAQAYQLQQGEPKRKYCENAVKVVQKAKDRSAVPGLSGLVKVPDSAAPYDAHRQEAAKALGDIGDPAGVEALVAALEPSAGTSADQRDKNQNRSNEVIAEALGELKDTRACGKLSEAMTKTRHDYTMLKSVRALGQIGCKDAVPALANVALKHENKFMRKNAIVALGDIGDAAATDALVQMMFVEFQGVSFYPEASFSLFQIGPSVSQALLDLMAGKNDAVNKYFEKTGGIKDTAIKAKAGFVLGDLRDMRAVEPLIQAFQGAAKATPPDPVVMIYASAPLAALGDKKAVPVLKEYMMTADASQRDPIMRALVQLGDRTLAVDMIKGMTSADFVERCQKQFEESKENCESDDTKAALFGAQKAAADHASNLAGAEHAAAYEKVIAEEKNAEMVTYFKARLVRVQAAVECKTDAACWAKKLEDKDPLVREKAAWELSWLRDPSTMDALAKNLGDKDNYARSAAINAYWAFGDKRAVPVIEGQLKADEGQATYIKVNQDLKRLLVALKRGAAA